MTEISSGERRSPLHDIHVDAGASFTDFAGWHMPVRYTSDLAEHHAVRTAAGIFDISHMAEITVGGPEAAEFLDYALAGNISAVPLGKAKYSLLLEAGGGIIDDLDRLPQRPGRVLRRRQRGQPGCRGGRPAEPLEGLRRRPGRHHRPHRAHRRAGTERQSHPRGHRRSPARRRARGAQVLRVHDRRLPRPARSWSARTGYTGEDGFELYVDVADAATLWHALVAAGTDHGLVPAGLASRDTLRLEAGMPLYGHELGLDTYPVQAGLGRVVALGKEGDFVGRAAIEAGPAEDARVLVGLASEGKRAGRAGYAVFRAAQSTASARSASSRAVRCRRRSGTRSRWPTSMPLPPNQAPPSRSTCAAAGCPQPSPPSRSTRERSRP